MNNKKTLDDFYFWLARCGIFHQYWHAVKIFCENKQILLTDFMGNMDANNPDTLFWFEGSGSGKFAEAKEKYANWLNE